MCPGARAHGALRSVGFSRDRDLTRATGTAIIAGYLAFAVALIVAVTVGHVTPVIAVAPTGLVAMGCAYVLSANTWC